MLPQFPPEEFDRWAAHYDQDVDAAAEFPFYGYAQVLETILTRANLPAGSRVLDLGTGTAKLAQLFARRGCAVWGLDFSAEMLARARIRLPQAHFAQVDIRAEWPPAFRQRYHAIVSGYTFHHFPLPEKVELVARLIQDHLLPGGRILIGDIAFENAAAEDGLRRAMGAEWEQEFYWLADEALDAFTRAGIGAEFTCISTCAGVFQFTGTL